MTANEVIVTAIASIPAVIGIVELAKKLGMPSGLAPLMALLTAIALEVLDMPTHPGWIWQDAFRAGVILGLTAAGLYSGAMTTSAYVKGRNNAPVGPAQ